MGLFDFFNKEKNGEFKNKEHHNDHDEKLRNSAKKQNLPPSIEGNSLKKIYAHNIEDGVFVVPKNVTSIESFAGSNLPELKKLVLHGGIKNIAPTAFSSCQNLVEVSGLEDAEMKMLTGFDYCPNLEKFSMPKSLYMIGEGAFMECKKLKDISIPDDCILLLDLAFAGCDGLKQLFIPSSMEKIYSTAFIYCKDLSLVCFENNDKKYYEDFLAEMNYEKPEEDEMPKEKPENQEAEYEPSLEDRIALYEDLNIRYRIVNLKGKDVLYFPKRLDIEKNALSDVKEVIVFSEDMISRVLNSGYQGSVSLVDVEKKEAYTIDFRYLKKLHEQKKQKDRDKFCSQFLIPSGGTTNWLINCQRNNYKSQGYRGSLVLETLISDDCRLKVEDFRQIDMDADASESYFEGEEFFTGVSIYKKEFDKTSIYAPQVYDRNYTIYYPYGTRFNKEMLVEIATALSDLIDNARTLKNNAMNNLQLTKIESAQKQLLDLLLKGTSDKFAVKKIMSGIKLKKLSSKIREAKESKDWLPYFAYSVEDEEQEFEDFKKYMEDSEGGPSK